jgi:phosphate transport system permease protein
VDTRSFWSRGIPFIWGTSSTVILALLLLVGMLGLIVVKGLSHFWPRELVHITLTDGQQFLGQAMEHEAPAGAVAEPGQSQVRRTKYKIGNRDVYGLDFKWIPDTGVAEISRPEDALSLERYAAGEMFGYLESLTMDSSEGTGDARAGIEHLNQARETAQATVHEIERLESRIARLYRPLNDLERRLAAAQAAVKLADPAGKTRVAELRQEAEEVRSRLAPRVRALNDSIATLRTLDARRVAQVRLADGRIREVRVSDIARAWYPNRMTTWERSQHYLAGLWTFVSAWPREANTSGGIFPAIYGTVLMVLLMTIAVVPLGVIAALYLHEYARDNWFVRAVRLAVSNLAGVPSIVFGVFGLGFFIYFVGANVDRLFFSEYLPSPTFGTGGILWASLTLALLTVPVVIVATEEGLAAVPRAYRDGSLALGATKLQTIRRIIIPHAMPGILTGVILAVSRGAGEVAPLMLTGVVPLVSDMPLGGSFPFVHLERKFMHLGFHIYDVGFQSPNVEAVKPLVYSTTLVLIVLVVLLNALAIILRNRLRARAKGSSV